MQSEFGSRQNRQISVTVPEKHFNNWLREQSKITRLSIRCDVVKASFPYLTVVLILLFTSVVYREALVGLAPTLVVWLLRNLKTRVE
jgi:hypothetical protein